MLRALVVVLAAFVATPACKSSESAPPVQAESVGGEAGGQDSQRVSLVPKDHPLYARFEGLSFDNACTGDGGCFKGGCSGEVCSATSDVAGTCEVLPVQIPKEASCGCVQGECAWWSDGTATLIEAEVAPEPAAEPEPVQQPGVACGDATCAPGEQCIEYYGVAGPQGPRFQTCGIPCARGKCPDGKKCVTIADGPGPVCQ